MRQQFLKLLNRLASPKQLAPIAVAVLGVIELTGIGETDWMKRHIAGVTLVALALILESAVLHIERLDDVESDLNEVRGEKLNRLESAITQLSSDLKIDPLEKLRALRAKLDPKISKVLGPYMDEHFETVVKIFTRQTFDLSSVEKFRNFYRATLETYEHAEIRATSIPFARFFWRGSETERAITDFIRKGGKMKRIFFLDDERQIDDPEVSYILRRQAQMKVEVYTVPVNKVPPEWRVHCFLVDTERRIGWKLTPAQDRTIAWCEATWDPSETQKMMELFEKLERLADLKKFEGGPPPDPNTTIGGPYDEREFENYERYQWEEESVIRAYHDYFGPLMQETTRPLVRAISNHANDLSGKKVLDIASGIGYIGSAAHEHGADVTALDFSAAAMEFAATHYPQIDRYEIGNAERLDFANNSFDAITMNFGIQHFARPELAVHEAYRVLTPGGRFAFTYWLRDGAQGIGIVMRALETYEEQTKKPPEGPLFFRFNDPDECRKILEAAGFGHITFSTHQLTWQLQSQDDLFTAFLQGTARIGGRLRAQDTAVQQEIRAAVKDESKRYAAADGRLHVPMSYRLVTAQKP